mgnify:CR=1 FL=1
MPRRPRVFIEGGIFHVYNRFARGAEIFSQEDEARHFLGLLREVKRRDELVVFACRNMGSDVCVLGGRGLSRQSSQSRILLVTLGVERWRQSPRELGRLLGRRADVVSRWVSWGADRRRHDRAFA